MVPIFSPPAFPHCPALPFLSFCSLAFPPCPLPIRSFRPPAFPPCQRFNSRQANMCYILDIAKYWVEIIAHICWWFLALNSMKFSLVWEKEIYIPDLWICKVDRQEICWRTSQTGMWTSGSYYSMMVGVLSWHDSNIFLSFSHSYLKLYLLHEFTGTIFSYIEGRSDWETIW